MSDSRLSSLERGLLALLLVLALALRLTALDAFLTADEESWNSRSRYFGAALARHDWRSTYQTGHPGVVTMWLGAIANRVEFLQKPWPLDAALRPLLNNPASPPGVGVPGLTLGARRLIALVSWLGLMALFRLLGRLFSSRIALVSLALVGLDPFLVAHARFHHLDGLLTTFATLSIVSLLVYVLRGRKLPYLLASAATAALAIANKSPGILLVPWAVGALLLPPLFGARSERRCALLHGAGALGLWGLAAAGTLFALWPALWVAPAVTLRNVFGTASSYAATPHEFSNYFWFAIRPDPGPGFYPVIWALRTTPWIILGLLVLPLTWREREWRLPLALFGLWAIPFALAMTVGDKKFDRYLLPIFPVLDIAAALGWLAVGKRWLARGGGRRAEAALIAALALAQFVLVWPTRPYYVSYYNPLLGGSQTAPRLAMVGWGEGLDRAAAYLNAKPDARDLLVSSWYGQEFGCLFLGRTLEMWTLYCSGEPDYYVLYLNAVQRDQRPDIRRPLMGSEKPEFVATVNGIDYAWVYRNTIFEKGEQAVLTHIAAQAKPGQDLILVEGNAPFARDYTGAVPLQEFSPPERDDAVRTGLQAVTQGYKHVWRVAYQERDRCKATLTAKRLQEQAPVGDRIAVEGVQGTRYDLPAELHFVPAQPAVASGTRFGEQIVLLGYDLPKDALAPGKPYRLRLYWQASDRVARSYTVFVQLFGPDGKMHAQDDGLPQGGAMLTNTWRPGETVLDDHILQVPADAPPGRYIVLLGLYDRDTVQRLPAIDPTGAMLADSALPITGLELGGAMTP